MDAADLHTAVMVALANGGCVEDEYDAAAEVLDTIFADENREALVAAMVHLNVAEQPELEAVPGWKASILENGKGIGYTGPLNQEPKAALYRLDGHFER